MSAAIIAAVVSAAAALLVSALSFAFSRKQQREADWPKTKLELYREYVVALSGLIEGRETPEAQLRYADAVNSLSLVAASPVLKALYVFQDENAYGNRKRDTERLNALRSQLLATMRDDLDPSRRRDSPVEFRFYGVPPITRQESKH